MTAIRVVPYVDTIDVALADADIHRVRAASTASCKHPREGPRAEALTSHASMPVLDAVSVASPPTSASCFQPPRSSAHAVDQRSMLGGLEAISGDHRASLCESERASTVSFFSIATHVVGVVVICRAEVAQQMAQVAQVAQRVHVHRCANAASPEKSAGFLRHTRHLGLDPAACRSTVAQPPR